jgi:hypothetical protein
MGVRSVVFPPCSEAFNIQEVICCRGTPADLNFLSVAEHVELRPADFDEEGAVCMCATREARAARLRG